MFRPDETLMTEALRRDPLDGEVRGYRIEAVIGRGAATTVYAANRGGSRYALKCIPLDGATRTVAQALINDAEALKKLRHEHLSQVFDVFAHGPAVWLAGSVAVGRPVDHYDHGILGWEVSLQVALRIARALAYAWRFHGIAHRDLKPSNVIIDLRGGVLAAVTITDHGLSRDGISAAEVVLGSPLFQAPEIRRGMQPDDACDRYSLGAILHLLINGQPPMPPEDGGAQRLAGIPPVVADLIQRLLAPLPAERGASWEETIGALEAGLGGNPFESPPTIRVERRGTPPVATGVMRAGTTPTATMRADPVGSWLFDRMRETVRVARDGAPAASLQRKARVGSYTITEVLRVGALIEQYAVTEAILGRKLVLKILTGVGMANPVLVDRLTSEGTLLASLHHPAFPFVGGRGRHEGREYLAVEAVTGADLKTYLVQKGRFSEGQTLWVANELAAAMDHAVEACRMVHRDLKPQHLAVNSGGGADRRLTLTDFATALYLAPRDIQDFSNAERAFIADAGIGKAVGTPAYMSPEQVRGEAPTPQMDMYAFGCVLYHLLAGETPFTAANALEMMQAQLEQAPPDIAATVEVTPSTAALIGRCLAKDPGRRFASWKQLRQVVQAAGWTTQAAQRRKDRGQTGVHTRLNPGT